MFRLGELCYEAKDLAQPAIFAESKVCREDVFFAQDDAYATIHLKRSKTDTNHEGVTVYIAPAEQACPIKALRRLFKYDPQPAHAPLFSIGVDGKGTNRRRGACTKNRVITALKRRMLQSDPTLPTANFSGHSFRKGAASEAARNGVAYDDIQILGRWRSDSARLYIRHDPQRMVTLRYQASKGSLPYVIGLPTPPASP